MLLEPKASEEVRQRLQELEPAAGLTYPRIGHDKHTLVCKTFLKRFSSLEPGQRSEHTQVVLHGT